MNEEAMVQIIDVLDELSNEQLKAIVKSLHDRNMRQADLLYDRSMTIKQQHTQICTIRSRLYVVEEESRAYKRLIGRFYYKRDFYVCPHGYTNSDDCGVCCH